MIRSISISVIGIYFFSVKFILNEDNSRTFINFMVFVLSLLVIEVFNFFTRLEVSAGTAIVIAFITLVLITLNFS